MYRWLTTLPWWLVYGLGVGVLFTLVATGLFVVGTRLFPDPERGPRTAGDDRRRAEIRAYLDALGEPYAEDHPVGGQPVAFYLPERDVAVTFDARAFFRIDGTDADAVLVEHELPGAALGARLPFDVPDPTPDPGSGDDSPGRSLTSSEQSPVEGAFAALGLSRQADPSEVRAAYRERVKAVHPDQGGDPEAFQRLREAYTVAKDAAE